MTRKNPHAVALGRKGAKATNSQLSPEELKAKMRRAAQARWAKTEKLVAEITKGTTQLLQTSQASQASAHRRAQKKAGK